MAVSAKMVLYPNLLATYKMFIVALVDSETIFRHPQCVAGIFVAHIVH